MINEAKKSDVKRMEKMANKILSDMVTLNKMFVKIHNPKTSMPAAYRTFNNWKDVYRDAGGAYGGWFEFVYDDADYITEAPKIKKVKNLSVQYMDAEFVGDVDFRPVRKAWVYKKDKPKNSYFLVVITKTKNKYEIDLGKHKNSESAKKFASGYLKRKFKPMESIEEGTCGYGIDGELGDEPAGPQLLKKKNESRNKSLGEKDLMKYLMKRFKFSKKKSIDTMKKAGFDTSMLEGFDLEEACQKGYMTHPTRKTKIMFGKRYRNCVKKEGVDTTVTLEQAGMIADNICVNCGSFTNENLRKWFNQRWVNIGKKKKGGGHPPCGTSGKKRGYAKCVPASKAASMSDKEKASATRRKRAAQNKKGRGGTSSLKGGGKKPIYVSTKPKK